MKKQITIERLNRKLQDYVYRKIEYNGIVHCHTIMSTKPPSINPWVLYAYIM